MHPMPLQRMAITQSPADNRRVVVRITPRLLSLLFRLAQSLVENGFAVAAFRRADGDHFAAHRAGPAGRILRTMTPPNGELTFGPDARRYSVSSSSRLERLATIGCGSRRRGRRRASFFRLVNDFRQQHQRLAGRAFGLLARHLCRGLQLFFARRTKNLDFHCLFPKKLSSRLCFSITKY